MAINTKLRLAVAAALAGAGLLAVQGAQAAGFSLLEQNTSGLGNAYAGAAAVAEDASTVFFNSAGLTELKRPSVVVNANLLNISSRFKDGGSLPALGQSLGGTGGNAGGTTLLPALYASVPLGHGMTGGVGVNAPFGLKTEYSSDWLGRFQAVKSEVKTLNINTALAFKVNNVVSLGFGVDYQTLNAELTSAVNYTGVIAQVSLAALAAPANLGLQGTSSVKGNDSTWGYDFGVLLTPTPGTKIGLSYRSATKYTVAGDATFVAPTSSNATGQAIITGASNSTTSAAAPTNGPISLNIKLPASARLALAQQLGSKTELLGEVSWMQWSSIPELRIQRSAGVSGVLKNTPENWENTWRYALGANFQVMPGVKLRVGAALDKSPVPDSTRTPRLPDKDRTWLSVGTKLAVTNNTSVDLGYSRVTAKDAPLNQSDGYTAAQGYPSGLIVGKQETHIDIFGAQATVSF